MTESTIPSIEPRFVLPMFGARDQHLRRIRDTLGVDITHRDGTIRVAGDQDAVAQATEVLEQLKSLVQRSGVVDPDDVSKAIARATGDESHAPDRPVEVLHVGREVRPKSPGQAEYCRVIRNHDLILAIGPAGSGIVFLGPAGTGGGGVQLWYRRWDNLEATALPASGAATGQPSVSPDGREVAFVAGGELRVAPLAGGLPRTLADSAICCTRWGSDGYV
ncbi:MAG: PhoH family protein, partial [Planctomycetes bacterium]|nr:PhoH family protein [Planctomycetota bacterium]